MPAIIFFNEPPQILRQYGSFSEIDDDELNEVLDDTGHHVELLENLVNELNYLLIHVYGIKCAAHTLQLAVRNGIKESNVDHLI